MKNNNRNTDTQLQKLIIFLLSYDQIEEWREIKGFNGKYFVSNLGNVLSLVYRKARILKPQDANGYNYVNLAGKHQKVHRLVANAFLLNPDNKPLVHHKDGNKRNNVVSNLDFATYKENTEYYYQQKKELLRDTIE